MADALRLSVEMVAALIAIVASFMYFEEILRSRNMYDVLIAVLIFGAGLIYLFSLVYNKRE
ncbi:hypothetical protein CL629_02890 [bacterium]|nr:hypothetical protein [bacterium]|tara:strand:- start:4142 stop:4324 length:183 start_codon:yes stop_codon:yes gene_type:complete